jgi:hypothetical protein
MGLETSPIPTQANPETLSLQVRLSVVGASALLWGFACLLPAFRGESQHHWPGWELFLWGPGGILYGHCGWLGNPVAVAALVAVGVGKHRLAQVLSCLAVLIGLQSLVALGTTLPVNNGTLLGGSVIRGLAPGFWLWLMSLATPCLGLLLARKRAE